MYEKLITSNWIKQNVLKSENYIKLFFFKIIDQNKLKI